MLHCIYVYVNKDGMMMMTTYLSLACFYTLSLICVMYSVILEIYTTMEVTFAFFCRVKYVLQLITVLYLKTNI